MYMWIFEACESVLTCLICVCAHMNSHVCMCTFFVCSQGHEVQLGGHPHDVPWGHQAADLTLPPRTPSPLPWDDRTESLLHSRRSLQQPSQLQNRPTHLPIFSLNLSPSLHPVNQVRCYSVDVTGVRLTVPLQYGSSQAHCQLEHEPWREPL